MASPDNGNQPNRRRESTISANIPSIKVLSTPTGKYSRATDEWCFTYCTQSVTGRYHRKPPSCRCICLRKVFAHEVRNVLGHRRHAAVDGEGNARYPLPLEGQPRNVPWYFGGTASSEDEDDEDVSNSTLSPTRYWREGLYFWASSGVNSTAAHLRGMDMDPHLQNIFGNRGRGSPMYIEFLKREMDRVKSGELAKTEQIISEEAVLLPLSLDVPQAVDSLLAPTNRVLSRLHESVAEGELQELGNRAFQKAISADPWKIAYKGLIALVNIFKSDK